MTPKILKFTLIFILFSAFCSLSYAEIPKLINYQGKLTDPQGKPLTTAKVTFRIYDAESGPGTMTPWEETYDPLQMDKGIFNVLLGGKTPLNLAFDKQYWLGIQVGSDLEMSPRIRLASVGYAFRSENANNATYATSAGVANTVVTAPARSQMFTSNGTFTAPQGVTMVYLTMVGAGGGGGGGMGSGNSGGGGGGGASGATIINYPVTVIPGNSYSVTVGVAGAGGSGRSGGTGRAQSGANGGATIFDSVSIPGGGGGSGAFKAGGNVGRGDGGTASRGPGGVPGAGGDGGSADESGNGKGGGGAPGYYGTGGAGGYIDKGLNATGYGAGGGGGGADAYQNIGYDGGSGTSGLCIVTY